MSPRRIGGSGGALASTASARGASSTTLEGVGAWSRSGTRDEASRTPSTIRPCVGVRIRNHTSRWLGPPRRRDRRLARFGEGRPRASCLAQRSESHHRREALVKKRSKLRRRYGRSSTSRVVEGVIHRPYEISFKTDGGRAVRFTHWSPGRPWLDSEIARYLDDRDDVTQGQPINIKKKGW